MGAFSVAGCSDLEATGGTPTQTAVSVVRKGDMEVGINQFYAKKFIRYYDSAAEQVKQLEPDRDWWAEASVSISNLGDGTVNGPAPESFTFVMGGEQVPAQTTLPGIEWSDVRLRERHEMYWVEPGYLGGDSEATPLVDALLYIFADVRKDESPRIEWDDGSETWSFGPEFLLLPPE